MESIEEFELKSKPSLYARFFESPYWVLTLVILVAISFFALGRFVAIESTREPVRVINTGSTEVKSLGDQPKNQDQSAAVISTEIQQVIGSKNGTKYHLPTCPGAKQISDKNKITFTSIDEAKAKGYTAAANCPGLK